MAAAEQQFHLAALCHDRSRRQVRRALAEHGSPAAAWARADAPKADPGALARACEAHETTLLTQADPAFPELLRQIPDPPLVLYARGDLGVLEAPVVAMVGARRCTRLGLELAERLAGDLAACGLTVVSGLARGIDTAAVLGSGLAHPYPAANRRLANAMLDAGGVLLSEYAPLVHARPHHFPERNRLISGLALAVVVVEAGERSGSLITARMALEQGREVMAVPGPVSSPASRGCHRLLRQGAALVESATDVLDALGLALPDGAAAGAAASARATDGLDPRARTVLDAVAGALTTLDEVVAATGVAGDAAAALLVTLELEGLVCQVPGGYIRLPAGGERPPSARSPS